MRIGIIELLIIGTVIFLVFGHKGLLKVGKHVGKLVYGFNDATKVFREEVSEMKDAIKETQNTLKD